MANPIIGVERVHAAILKNDPLNIVPGAINAAPPEYDDPFPLADAATLNISSSDAANTAYYDNAPRHVLASKSDRTIAFTRAAISNAERQKILGLAVDSDGITIEGADSTPPHIALGFVRKKKAGNGFAWDYTWYLKGLMYMNTDNSSTQTQTVAIQDRELNGTFVARMCDNQIVASASTDDPGIAPEVFENWFTAETLNKLRFAVSAKITGITVNPNEATTALGATQTFTAEVIGENSPSQTVNWAVYGGNSAETTISGGGLTVGEDETAATLMVVASSAIDPSKKGTAVVTVEE